MRLMEAREKRDKIEKNTLQWDSNDCVDNRQKNTQLYTSSSLCLLNKSNKYSFIGKTKFKNV